MGEHTATLTEISATVEHQGDKARVALVGSVTETADLSRILTSVPRHVVLDLAGIRRVNSSGVLLWIAFLRDIKRMGATITLERCSPAVVAQLNSVSSFRGGSEVRSVLAPYDCSRCGHEQFREILLGSSALQQLTAPATCERCGAPCSLDDIPEHFLAFYRT